MGFRFTLESVLRYRENMETREELALQKIMQEIVSLTGAIDQLAAQIAAGNQTRSELLKRPVSALYLQALLNELAAAGKRRTELLTALAALEQKRDEQLEIYHAAHRGRQMLTEMLTEQQDLYEQECVRSEQKTLDDLFAARAQRA